MATKEFESGKSKYKMYIESSNFVKRFAKELRSNEIMDDGMTTADDVLDNYREELETKNNFWSDDLMNSTYDELDNEYEDFHFDNNTIK